MLSLIKMGMPWRGPRLPCSDLSVSSSSARRKAVALISETACKAAPFKFTSSVLAKYAYGDGDIVRYKQKTSSIPLQGG